MNADGKSSSKFILKCEVQGAKHCISCGPQTSNDKKDIQGDVPLFSFLSVVKKKKLEEFEGGGQGINKLPGETE